MILIIVRVFFEITLAASTLDLHNSGPGRSGPVQNELASMFVRSLRDSRGRIAKCDMGWGTLKPSSWGIRGPKENQA